MQIIPVSREELTMKMSGQLTEDLDPLLHRQAVIVAREVRSAVTALQVQS